MTIPGKTWKDQKRKKRKIVKTNPTRAEVLRRRLFDKKADQWVSRSGVYKEHTVQA